VFQSRGFFLGHGDVSTRIKKFSQPAKKGKP
jgi:hypothetical protein